jgi:predicted dinucleotide-binding enzyme
LIIGSGLVGGAMGKVFAKYYEVRIIQLKLSLQKNLKMLI